MLLGAQHLCDHEGLERGLVIHVLNLKADHGQCVRDLFQRGGGPVRAMLIQNTNPAVVAPDTNKVLEGLRRDDLFLVVHEQFMTETAALADIVLPATMFLEHDDLYQGG
ncbi:MAG: molybdopterin-dependent oxidoreductase, partial [Pseudomonadota bacterium]